MVVIYQWAAVRSAGLRRLVMAASHGITDEIMHHLAVGSDAGVDILTKSVHPICQIRVCGYFWKCTMSCWSSIFGRVLHMWRDRNWPRLLI